MNCETFFLGIAFAPQSWERNTDWDIACPYALRSRILRMLWTHFPCWSLWRTQHIWMFINAEHWKLIWIVFQVWKEFNLHRKIFSSCINWHSSAWSTNLWKWSTPLKLNMKMLIITDVCQGAPIGDSFNEKCGTRTWKNVTNCGTNDFRYVFVCLPTLESQSASLRKASVEIKFHCKQW